MSQATVSEFGPVLPAFGFERLRAALSRLTGETAAADHARAKAWQLDAEAIRPAFQASSREKYWAIRDAMFATPERWLVLYSETIAAIGQAESKAAPVAEAPTDALDRFERSPPRFLSADARRHLVEAMRRLARLPGADALVLAPAGALPADAPARLRRMAGSALLLSLWAGLMIHGTRPQSDEVADSIAQNYANLLSGFAGMAHVAGSPADADEAQ